MGLDVEALVELYNPATYRVDKSPCCLASAFTYLNMGFVCVCVCVCVFLLCPVEFLWRSEKRMDVNACLQTLVKTVKM